MTPAPLPSVLLPASFRRLGASPSSTQVSRRYSRFRAERVTGKGPTAYSSRLWTDPLASLRLLRTHRPRRSSTSSDSSAVKGFPREFRFVCRLQFHDGTVDFGLRKLHPGRLACAVARSRIPSKNSILLEFSLPRSGLRFFVVSAARLRTSLFLGL